MRSACPFVCMYVCLLICPLARFRKIVQTSRVFLYILFVAGARCITLGTSSFVDDVTFSRNGRRRCSVVRGLTPLLRSISCVGPVWRWARRLDESIVQQCRGLGLQCTFLLFDRWRSSAWSCSARWTTSACGCTRLAARGYRGRSLLYLGTKSSVYNSVV